MATSFHPSDIQYVSDSNVQLQSMTFIRNSSAGYNNNNGGHYNASYQDSDSRDLHQNGNGTYANGSGSNPAAFSHHQPTPENYETVEMKDKEEEEASAPVRTEPPKDFYGFSVFVMIFFLSPIALTAVQSARACRKAISMRDMVIADARSQEAKGRACLGLVTGIAAYICVASFIVLGVLS